MKLADLGPPQQWGMDIPKETVAILAPVLDDMDDDQLGAFVHLAVFALSLRKAVLESHPRRQS